MSTHVGVADPRAKVWSGYTRKSLRGKTLYDTMLRLGVTHRAWRDFMAYLPFGLTGTLVDAGTGTGVIARDLAVKNPGAQVVAFDPTWELLQVARERSRELRNVQYFRGDVTKRVAQVQDGAAQVVAINWVLCYLSLTEQYAAAAEIFRMLAPGGTVFGSAMIHPHTFKEVVGHNWPREIARSPLTLMVAMIELVPHITKPFDEFYRQGLANYPTIASLKDQHLLAGFAGFEVLQGIMPIKKGHAAVIWKATKAAGDKHVSE